MILPIEPKQSSFRVLNSSVLDSKGDNGIREWMTKVEDEWKNNRKKKSQKYDIYQWIDFRSKLSNQNPGKRYLVLYLTGGTFLAATMIDRSSNVEIDAQGSKMKVTAFIADTKCYYYQTDNVDEAHYLTAILNSKVLDTLTKPIQSTGLKGPRDFHKKPLEFPIPIFNSNDNIHTRLKELGSESLTEIKPHLHPLISKLKIQPENITANQVGRLRSEIRKILNQKISEIDDLVCNLFTS